MENELQEEKEEQKENIILFISMKFMKKKKK